jgi:hypothetical protein
MMRQVKRTADWEGKSKRKIFVVIRNSGEYFEFSKKNPGRIIEDKIVGIATVKSKKIEIAKADITETSYDSKGNVTEITDRDGKTYKVLTGIKESTGDKIVFFNSSGSSGSVVIPLSEVKSLQIKPRLGFLPYLIAGAVSAGLIAVALTIGSFSRGGERDPAR